MGDSCDYELISHKMFIVHGRHMRGDLNSREKFITHGRHMRVELLSYMKGQSS